MPLPHETWFRVRDAVAAGHTRESLKSRHLEVPFYGIRSHAGHLESVEDVCAAYATKIAPGAAFTGATAARLWQMPLPSYLGSDFRTVDVAARSPHRSPRGMHVSGSQYDPRLSRVDRLDELPVLSAVDTWCSLATVLDPMDLVAVADHLIADHPRPQLARSTLDELHTAVDIRRGMRGRIALRWALDRARPRAWSRTESLIRVVLQEVGVPEPVLNHPVSAGGRRFWIDLAWPEYGFGLEYDGDQHRDRRQFTDDIHRQELIHDQHLSLMRATRVDLFDRTGELVRRVERRLRERGCRVSLELSQLVIPRR
jgi:hypothetical protein